MKIQHLPDGFLKHKLIHFPRCLPCFQTPAVCSLFPGCHPFRALWVEFPTLDLRLLSPRFSSDLSDTKPLCEVSFLSNTCAHFLEKAFVSLVCVCCVSYNSLSAFSSLWPCLFSFSALHLCLESSLAFPDHEISILLLWHCPTAAWMKLCSHVQTVWNWG